MFTPTRKVITLNLKASDTELAGARHYISVI
jgi:hypothetical protein